MKEALVIHPQISYYAGGELLCLHVCNALQETGYRVTLACDVFNPTEVDRHFGLGSVIQKCRHKKIPKFAPIFPHLVALQRILYAVRMRTFLSKTNAEVVFSTQSSSFHVPNKKLFHFVYDALDVFNHPLGSNLLGRTSSRKPIGKPYYFLLRQVRRLYWDRYTPRPTVLFATGTRVVEDLIRKGHPNSTLIFPPCRTVFKPKFPKKKQVVQFTRILPTKRIELFLEIAKKLPQYPFYIVGRIPPESRGPNFEYTQRMLSALPRNVTYIEALTRERPDLLEHSKVYLYTGIEAGIGVALVEAISAGCIPFSPHGVGAADVIAKSGAGLLFDSAEEAAKKIKITLETEHTDEEISEISDKARMFSPESFEEQIKKMVS